MKKRVNEIVIKEYQNLQDVFLPKLGNLTIFFGQNNSGKTAFLNWIAEHYQPYCNYVTMDEITFLFADKTIGVDDYIVELRKRALEDLYLKCQQSDCHYKVLNYFKQLTGIELEFVSNGEGPYFLVESNGKMQKKELYKLGNAFVAILAALVEILWNDNPIILIDEPEMSLHASLQKKFFAILKDIAEKDGKQIFIATHSHLFLDRTNPLNNYKISVNTGRKEIHQLKTFTDVVVAIYQLLGNTPDDLLMPNNFIIVEGPSDKIFLVHLMKRFFAKQLENKHIIVQPAHGDLTNRQITTTMHHVDQFFSVIQGNPLYRDRAVILVDEQPPEVLEEFKNKYHLDKPRFRTLGEMGFYSLEYSYPEAVLLRVARKIKTPKFKKKDIDNLLDSISRNKHNKKVLWADEIGREIKKEEVPPIFFELIQTAIDGAY